MRLKPTDTDQYLNCVSNHPSNTKDALISALFSRARDTVSVGKDLDENSSAYRKNDYKKSKIMAVKKRIEKSKRQ